MTTYYAILIDGDNENTLGGACSRDLWNISKKLLNDLPILPTNIHTFFHDLPSDRYVKKIQELEITNTRSNHLANIKNCFDYIISMSKLTPTVIIFHYSGHGYQVPDDNGDEIDGMDEIFLGHTMRDDYIWDNLVSLLPKSAHIISFMDACHSGSGMDMPYMWNGNSWILAKKNNYEAKCTGYSLSACNDVQCASQDIGETTGFAGSLTAGICDCCNLKDIIYQPFLIHQLLAERLRKLHQNVELYSVQK